MPTRIIREGILTSEKVNALSERAELFYRRLLSVVADSGRNYAHPITLRGACYPLKPETAGEAEVSQFLNECVQAGLIEIYGQGKFLTILNFGQQRRAKSKFPAPEHCQSRAVATDAPARARDQNPVPEGDG